MLQITGGALAQVASGHPVLSVRPAGTGPMLAVLTAVALSRCRALGVAVESAARPGVVTVVMWSLAWPVALPVVGARPVGWR